VQFGRGKDKDHVRGRLFESFEECIEGRCRKHMNFVDDIDAVFANRRHVLNVLTEVADVVDAGV
jgi:hypothetical protein